MTRWNYDRRFKKFRSSVTDKDWFDDMEEEIYRSYEHKDMGLPSWMKGTESRLYRLHKKKILNKWERVYDAFKQYTKIAPNLDEAVTWYHTMCLQDPELHALNYVRPDNGMPMFLFPWQSDFVRKFDEYDICYSLDTRKLGKTGFCQFLGSYWASLSREHLRIFAPTDDQLHVLRDILTSIEDSDFMYEEFVIGPYDEKRKRGGLTVEKAKFGRNGSTIKGTTLSQKSSKGKSKVGEKGSRFIVDEWGLIENDIFDTVIFPMMADTSSRKKIAAFGTATLDINPDMESIWDDLCKDNTIYTKMYPWTYGVKVGAISKWYMKQIFKKTHVPCPFGRNYGICAKDFIGDDVRFDESSLDEDGFLPKTHTPPLRYPGDTNYDESWECDESCYLSKKFAEEHWAKFVSSERQYWPFSMIQASADPALPFWSAVPPGHKPELYVSVDFGLRFSRTQALVGEKVGNTMIVRAWREILPIRDKKEEMGPGAGARLYRELYEFLAPFIPHVKQYFFDITGDKMGWMSEFLINGIDDVPGYPKNRIYQTEKNKEQNLYGIDCQGQQNSIYKENLRTQIMGGCVKWPHRQPFFDTLMWEFQHCKAEKTQNGYMSFKEPTSGKKSIDLLDSLSFLVIPMDPTYRNKGKTYFSMRSYTKTKKKPGGSYYIKH